MNVFQFVADQMKPNTRDLYLVQALIAMAGDESDNYSGYTVGQDKLAYVKNFFRTRYGAESPVYQAVATSEVLSIVVL